MGRLLKDLGLLIIAFRLKASSCAKEGTVFYCVHDAVLADRLQYLGASIQRR